MNTKSSTAPELTTLGYIALIVVVLGLAAWGKTGPAVIFILFGMIFLMVVYHYQQTMQVFFTGGGGN